jgi:hypothetical protein
MLRDYFNLADVLLNPPENMITPAPNHATTEQAGNK